jgi:hypothetical protein
MAESVIKYNGYVEGTLTGSTYWNLGVANSKLYKIGQLVTFKIWTSAYDTKVPAGGFTTIGTVSFKPIIDMAWVIPSDENIMQIKIDTNGNINIYNYSSSPQLFAVVFVITYITND